MTPGHSHVDYEMARGHGLPCISVIEKDGTMASECGEWLQVGSSFGRASCLVGGFVFLLAQDILKGVAAVTPALLNFSTYASGA